MRAPLLLPFLALFTGCDRSPDGTDASEGKDTAADPALPLFTEVHPDSSGIRFANTVEETETRNYYMYEYMYNGGGVAAGDLNNDGLTDLYFTGNLVPDRLYLNKGGLRFRDATDAALPEEAEHGWHSGVTMADVNGDGWLDIYVCRAGWWKDPTLRTNLYYENQGADEDGVPRFKERAAELGMADTTRSTQAAFFDADGDADLDLFVINCPIQGKQQLSNVEVNELVRTHRSPSSRFYRNNDGRFTDATAAAGLWSMGFALGLSVSDLDVDGDMDIYVACDYIEPDKLYINDGSGKFTEEVKERTRHTSNFGMGSDAADYDNDGLPDLAVLDMVSEDHVRSKKNMGAMSADKFWGAVSAGYHYQYMFNTLQLNNGNGTFSEVGQLAGVSKTDWSWAPLFCDLDNDGWKDLFITNGYKRDMRDNDYMITARKIESERTATSLSKMLALVPSTRIRDYAYRNNGDLTFTDATEQWGLARPGNDNGAAYADLDNDGDLDLVVNNVDEPATLFANRASSRTDGNWLRVSLEKSAGSAIGSRVTIEHDGRTQVQELMLTRGYQSSVEPVLHFGLGASTNVRAITVHWPDGTESVLNDVRAGQTLPVKKEGARPAGSRTIAPSLLHETAVGRGLHFTHRENTYDDFQQEVLLPHKQSANGPLLGVGDANGDGRDDLYVGGARDQAGMLFLQQANGTFNPCASQPWKNEAGSEDLGSLFFDADGDGDQDLFVASGSNETSLRFEQYDSRLYLNDGKAGFHRATDAFPPFETSAMRATAADIDADGDLDLFVGGRITPGMYPKAPRSYLLLNDGKAHFSDATEQLAPALIAPGLVTDCEFLDHDGDSDPDLVLVGEWMPISFFENNGGRFTPANDKTGLKDTEGWWWSLTRGDLDGDGDDDLVCGNLGWNHKFKCSPQHPFHVFWNDFDDNGHADIVLAKENQELGLVPVRGRECSSQQCAIIKERFPTYDAFARANIEKIYSPQKIGSALHLQAKHMRSCVLLNQGGGRFTLVDLPNRAQSAPIMGSVVSDIDSDGNVDLVVAGNHWGAEVETVRYDGGTGLVLKGDGKGGFTPMGIAHSGLFAWQNVKDLALVRVNGGIPLLVVANNNDRMQAFEPRRDRSSLALTR